MTTLVVMYVLSGLGLAALAVPLILRKVPPNGLYGVRLPATLNDPEIWYDTNQHSGWRMLVAGLITALAAVGLWLVPGITIDQYALGCLAVFAVAFGIGLVQTLRYMNGLVRAKQQVR